MRGFLIAGLIWADAAVAQDAPRLTTLAELELNRPAWAGDLVRIERATIFDFAQHRGGLVKDATRGAKLDDAGMTPSMIYRLERYCSGSTSYPPRPQCRGSLIFKVTLREEYRGAFTIRAAEFIPDD